MANKLAALGMRILGFNTSSCCAAPAAEAVKPPAAKAVEIMTPDPTADGASCCAPSCCQSTAPANAKS